MKENQPISSLLKRLWHHISPRRRGQFGLLLGLMLLASFAEILSIGAVLPFLGVLTAPERIFNLPLAQPFINGLNINEPAQLLFPLTVAFSMAAIIAGSMRLVLLWASTKLSFATGADLSISIYSRTLYQPYIVHCERNSSEVINAISGKTSGVIYVMTMVLTLLSSAALLIAILITLLIVNPLITLIAFGGFGLIYLLIVHLTRKELAINSKIIARESTQVIKSLQEGLGGIRDVLIDGSQTAYCQIYRNADLPLRRAQGSTSFIGQSPRYAMEALGMILIAFLAYSLALHDGIDRAIPLLGALAIGAQRFLPVLQQAYGAWAGIKGWEATLQDALELLDQPLPGYLDHAVNHSMSFNHCITLKQMNFRYSSQSPYVLKGIDLKIAKGSRVGFIGATGSGKSTLLDIVMGLLQPTNGSMEIDNKEVTSGNHRAWQEHIAHVPQAIFLADSSIEENIAFGIPKDQIDHDRVRQAAQQAQIAESIESWPEQYETFVGERGIRLSGGQRQRVGIARALYKRADVIIFDEATSALDNETENAVMNSIESLNKDVTLLIIAHRLTTLKNCNQIVELSDGEILRSGSYENLIKQSGIKASYKNSGDIKL
jgi:ABC-type bacteriocin/lantibiotic exporter with double-glycine peptidase domain